MYIFNQRHFRTYFPKIFHNVCFKHVDLCDQISSLHRNRTQNSLRFFDGVDLSSRIVKLVSKHLQTSIHALSKSAQLTLQYILERSVMATHKIGR